jgi:peptidoglycan/xylan/chitin deacetylase (PgdA/CDA1 family)
VKKTIYSITEALGVNRLSAAVHRNRPLILTFHGVTSELGDTICNDEGLHLHRPLFERLMQHVARYYNPVPLSRIVDWLEGKGAAPERGVAVTFDDGFRNVLTDAAPILKKHGIPATLFVTTDFVFKKEMLWPDRLLSALTLTKEPRVGVLSGGVVREFNMANRAGKLDAYRLLNGLCKSMPGDERLALVEETVRRLNVSESKLFSAWSGFRPLEPEELRLLPKYGVTVGAHTCSHPVMARVSAHDQTHELVESKRLIEATTGVVCDEFAYPNGGPGDFNADTRTRVVDAGYRSAFTTIKKRVSHADDRFEIPRCTLTHNRLTLAEFSAELSGLPGALRVLLNRPGAGAAAKPRRNAALPTQGIA